MHIYILPQCSTPAASLLNLAGMPAQSQRLRCAISRGILNHLFQIIVSLADQSEKQGFLTGLKFGISLMTEADTVN